MKLSKLSELYKNCEYSVGDTPSNSLVNDYPSFITEIRPEVLIREKIYRLN